MLTKALVPLDGSELAEGILPYVLQLAKGLDMAMLLLTVVDPDDVEVPGRPRAGGPEIRIEQVPGGAGGQVVVTPPERERSGRAGVPRHETGEAYASQAFEAAEANAKARLENVARGVRRQGLRVATLVTFGRPAESIVETAEQEGCDLIAMSTHGRNPLGRAILGSVTDKVMHSSSIPTLTITPERAKEYRQGGSAISRVMVPLDGSPLAETALPYVEHIARKMSLEVMLVRVVRIGPLYTAYSDGYPPSGYAEIEREIEDEAKDYLRDVALRMRDKGLKVEWKVLRGVPAASIVEAARETPQDVIALTTHGRSGITRWILGSVTESLIRTSGDPVLVIPPVQEERN